MTEKEELARLLWEAGALRLTGGEPPLAWASEAALENAEARGALLDALEAMVRDHYARPGSGPSGRRSPGTARRTEGR